MNIILGSSSPRRIEILKKYIDDFKIDTPKLESENMSGDNAESVVMSLALSKAQDVYSRNEGSLVVSFDTVIVYEGRVIGKPRDESEAFTTLKSLSGNEHKVITGMAFISPEKKVVDLETTIVKFKKIEDNRIEKYIASSEPMGKAGSYEIQGIGEIFIESIIGSYSNVVGLPISKFDNILRSEFDIDIL